MAKQTDYDKRIYIERQDENEAFEKFLDSSDDAPWALNLYGRGGIGKTQLLNRFVGIIAERRGQGQDILLTGDLIDVYWTAHQREIGIMKSIVEQLSPDRFLRFREGMDKRNKHLADPERDREQDVTFDKDVRKAFFEAYENLKVDRIVILFDTAEKASDAAIKFWCETMVELHESNPKTRVVIAGRYKLADIVGQATIIGFNSEALLEKTISREIAKFSQEHVREYFARKRIKVSDDYVERVADLSEGRPVLIALTVDWLHSGNAIRDLSGFDKAQFERAMVDKVRGLKSPFDRVILAMAHLHRRFNEKILTYILDFDEMEAKKLAVELSDFSFVKYRETILGQEGSFVLHDDMCDMVNKYVWGDLDPSGSYRISEYNRKILKYYDELLTQINDQDERNNLMQERLYYWLDIDLDPALEEYRKNVRDLVEAQNPDVLDALNKEVSRVKMKLSSDMQVELEFNISLSKIWRGRENVIPALESLIQDPHCGNDIRVRTLRELLWLYTAAGRFDAADKCTRELRVMLAKQDPKNFDDHMRLRCAWVYNNIGYYFRHRSNYDKAIENYQTAQSFLKSTRDSDLLMARVKNNLGFVYHRVGKDDEAEEECRFALKLRQRLSNMSELGFSYNTLGIISLDQWKLTEATNYFEKAIEAFQKAENEWGESQVNLYYGRLKRQSGLYKDKIGTPTPDRDEYRQAEIMLDKACAFFKRLEHTAYLAEALNEKGTLYRQQCFWQKAIDAFDESSLVANKIDDKYREADNYQDIAIVYENKDDLHNAFKFVEKAENIVRSINNRYLLARVLRTKANILFKEQKSDDAFAKAAEALTYFLRLDPENLSYSAVKRDAYYQEWVEWITDKVVELPSREIAEAKSQDLLNELENKGLLKLYLGLKLRLEALPDRFDLLSKD